MDRLSTHCQKSPNTRRTTIRAGVRGAKTDVHYGGYRMRSMDVDGLAATIKGARVADLDSISDSASLINNKQRWKLVDLIIAGRESAAIIFIHVPKTGGTTFGETLAEDKKADVISVDAPIRTFVRQVYSASKSEGDRYILIRSHHPLSLFSATNVFRDGAGIISAYRDPLEIHTSNVNMIMSRIKKYLTSPESLSFSVREFSKRWIDELGFCPEQSRAGAMAVIDSNAYSARMSGIYSRFFDADGAKELIEKGRIFVASHDKFELILCSVFGYESIPERKNVSDVRFIVPSDVDSVTESRLCSEDNQISRILRANLRDPKKVNVFGAQIEY